MGSHHSSTPEQRKAWLTRAGRREQDGWLHIRIAGAPFERGYQYGALITQEYAEAINAYKAMTYQTTGMTYAFFVEQAVRLQRHLIPEELLEEMDGIAAGLSDHGVPSSLDDIIGWNAWMEIVGNWWPQNASKFVSSAAGGTATRKVGGCSAFVATGSATTDGSLVIGHESFTEFWNGQYLNVILDITPDNGHRIVMQTSPGWIASMTDFYVTSAGLVVVETTIVGYNTVGYDVKKTPRICPGSQGMPVRQRH